MRPKPDSLLDDELTPAAQAEARHRAGRNSTLVSVAVNIGLTAVQAVAGVISGSQALIADAAHSLSDLLSDFVVLAAAWQSRKDPDADHQYGHLRFETGASLALGVLLLTVGVGMLWAALGKLQSAGGAQPVQPVALWVALATLASKELLFRYMLAAAERVRSSMLVANAWHARSDAASSLVVALGIVGNLAGFPLLDPVAALIVGFMVSKMGWEFGWEALHDLMDRSASQDQIAQIGELIRGTPGVQGLHDLRTRKMGDMILVDAHLEVDGQLTVQQGHDIAVQARQRVMQALPVLDVLTHLDPVVPVAPAEPI